MGTKRRDKIMQTLPPYVRRANGRVELCLPAEWVKEDPEKRIVVVEIKEDDLWPLVQKLAVVE